MAKITLDVNVPDDVSGFELLQMVQYKFMGHSISGEVLSKFEHEEFDVEDFTITS